MIRQLLQLFEEVVRNRLASDDGDDDDDVEANVDEVKTTASETEAETVAESRNRQDRQTNEQPPHCAAAQWYNAVSKMCKIDGTVRADTCSTRCMVLAPEMK